MKRKPYGSFRHLTPEQQLAHKHELSRRFRERHRERLNARNAEYIKLWRKTKPFVIQCKYCGADFNAPRRTTRMCPNCHQKAHDHALQVKIDLIARRNAKALLMDKVVELRKKGLQQTEIAHELNISQKTVSNYLVKMGYRTMPEYHRRKKI